MQSMQIFKHFPLGKVIQAKGVIAWSLPLRCVLYNIEWLMCCTHQRWLHSAWHCSMHTHCQSSIGIGCFPMSNNVQLHSCMQSCSGCAAHWHPLFVFHRGWHDICIFVFSCGARLSWCGFAWPGASPHRLRQTRRTNQQHSSSSVKYCNSSF